MKHTVTFNYAWSRPYIPAGGAEKVYLLIEARGNAPATAERKRAPINLSLVLDRSGSMAGQPLAYSKKACQFVTEQMGADDQLSLVAFDDEVNTVFPPAGVTHKDRMKAKIEAIQPGGTTNLSGGLIAGAQYVRKGKREGTVNRVILLSDGHANEGVTDRGKLAAIAREYGASGVGITAMGVGDGFDEELMEAIADNGGGSFYYIEKADEIPSIFEQELKGLLTVVAQNVRFTLKLSDFATVKNVYGYKTEDAFGEKTVHVGDLYHEEVKTILLELEMHAHPSGSHPALLIDWEYVDVTAGAAACAFSYEVMAEYTDDLSLLGLPGSIEVQKHVELTQTAKVIESAMEALDRGDFEQGKQMLKQQADQMMVLSAQLEAPILAMESAKLSEQLENFTYSSGTRKSLHQQKYRQMKRK